MRTFLKTLAIGWLLTAAAWSQSDAASLDQVLSQMDAAARNFKTTEASFVWDQYYVVIKEIDETARQSGKIYLKREAGEIQMAADILEPAKKYFVYNNGKAQMYQPKIDQVQEFSPGKNKGDVESYLVLGFGGSGHDLLKSYDLKFLGSDNVGGTATERLELIPKSEHVRANIARILLWIDLARGVSVQQQFFEPSGDYRLAKYSDIKINQKLPDNAFKLKTTGKTRFISPQG
jgi:outer membrane lipoprotein-sorting protein